MRLFRLSTIVEHLCIDAAYLLLRLRERFVVRTEAAKPSEKSGVVHGPGLLGDIPGTAHTA